MINQRNWAGWVLGVGCMFVVGVGGAAAQAVFSTALDSSLSGDPGSALPILVLADVGSWGSAGPAAPDGNLDLVTADQSGVATVWYGNGDGTFSQSSGTVLNRTPTALVIGDFDGDQIPDLAIAVASTDPSGSLVLIFGNGDGTFPGSCAGGERAGFPCVSDRRCPGSFCAFQAVSAGGRCSSTITMSCSANQDCPDKETCSAYPVALTATDMNDDGKLDLIVVNDTQSASWVSVLFGDGQGGFTPGAPVDLLGPGSSAVAFFEIGGNVSVAVTKKNTNSVVILRGASDGSLSVAQTISEDPNGKEPVALAAGDLDKDGHPDVVAVNHVSDNIGVFMGQADGSLQLQRFVDSGAMNSAPNGVALFDANGDGRLDVAVSNSLSSDVSVVLGDGTGNFGLPRAFVTDQEPLAVAAGDLDPDKIPDLVALNRDNTTPDAVVLLGQGDGAFKGVEDVIVEPTPNAVIAGDTDNDGLADLIVAHPTGKLLVRRALPSGGFATPVALQAAGDAFAIGGGDFNADGRFDIVALNRSTSNVSMFLGQSNGFQTAPQNYAVGAGGLALAVADWDQNGRSDIAVARHGADSSGAVDILLSNADGSLQEPPVSVVLSSNPVAMDWGDFNHDGHLDLALAISGSQVVVALGNGNGTFQLGTAVPIPGASIDATALAVADFDGDGSDDIAALLPSHNNLVALLYGNGQGGFTSGGTLQLSSAPWSLAARDLSGDLLPDLVASVHADTHVVVPFFNQGGVGQFIQQTSVPVSRSQGSTTIVAADFDGDGRYDVASANDWTAGSVSVLTNIGAAPVIRGDGNGDDMVTAADLPAVARKLRDGAATRVEQVARGSYAAAPGADANGDGLVTAQDARALVHRLFPRI